MESRSRAIRRCVLPPEYRCVISLVLIISLVLVIVISIGAVITGTVVTRIISIAIAVAVSIAVAISITVATAKIACRVLGHNNCRAAIIARRSYHAGKVLAVIDARPDAGMEKANAPHRLVKAIVNAEPVQVKIVGLVIKHFGANFIFDHFTVNVYRITAGIERTTVLVDTMHTGKHFLQWIGFNARFLRIHVLTAATRERCQSG